MDFKAQVFNYLIDIEEDKAAEIIIDSEFTEIFEDELIDGFDTWDLCAFQIKIRGKYLKLLEKDYKSEKELIEDTLMKFAQTEKKVVRHISWLPLPRIYSIISEFNQNDRMKQYLVENNFNGFFRDVKAIFASLPYSMKITEAYFHSNVHILLSVLGFEIRSEDETNIGRIDSVIEFTDKILIFEFKLSSSEIALQQIKDRKYFEKFQIKGKVIFLIGVSCNLAERNINDWKVEKYEFTSRDF